MTETTELHVCVVGAGIVGLASSILLRRDGHKVTVLEKDPSLHARPAGGIQLHPNAIRILQDIGVYDKVKAKAVHTRTITLKQYATGQTLHCQDLSQTEEKYGAPVVTVQRAHLRQVIYDAATALGVEFRFGIAVKTEDLDLDGGVLKTHDSGPFSADLFIGADGANSVLREVITNQKAKLVPHGFVVHRIVIEESLIQDSPNLRHLVENPNIIVWLGPKSQAVTYSLDGVFNIAFTRPWSSDPFYGPQVADLDVFRESLDAEGWDPVLRELIGLGTACHRWMFTEPQIDGERTPWVHEKSRFCIVGDAAHQTLPYLAQGAAMGLESASTLARLLSKVKTTEEIGACLGVFQRISKERTSNIIRASLKNGRMWQLPNGPLQEERDRELLHDTPSAGFPNLLADPYFQHWLWGFDSKKAADDAWDAFLT